MLCDFAAVADAKQTGCPSALSSTITKNKPPYDQCEACADHPLPAGTSSSFRLAIQKGTRVLISLWDSLMFGRVPQNAAAFLGTRPNISESHSEISTRVPFCIAAGERRRSGVFGYPPEH